MTSILARAGHDHGSGRHWLQWLLGAALLAAVIVVALHWSEAREIAAMAERLQPAWLLLAVTLQLGTYVAQGAIWRALARRLKFALSRTQAFRLSLAKLFIDQALPAAGVSGAVAIAGALERRGMERHGLLAGVLVNTSAYFIAYVVCLGLALPLVPLHGTVREALWITAGLFIVASSVLAVALLVLPARATSSWLTHLSRRRRARGIRVLQDANHPVARDRTLLIEATAYQVLIVLLDAVTMWSLVKGLGTDATIAAVFGSFMVSNLFRTLGILPGGLGTFEASSVLTLQAIGVPVPVALAATLLFRGLSFWLPMLPGVWFARELLRPRSLREHAQSAQYWSRPLEEVFERLRTSSNGLTAEQAGERLARFGRNEIATRKELTRRAVFLRQLSNPLLLLLVFAAFVAALTGEWVDTTIVLTIVVASAIIGYRREYSAHRAAELLRARINVRTRVLRDGVEHVVPAEEVAPGDVLLLSAGSLCRRTRG